jgi:hypothetical protein
MLSLLQGVEPKADDLPPPAPEATEPTPTEESPLIPRLRFSPEVLELVHNTDALLTQTLGHLLLLLRVFSFS